MNYQAILFKRSSWNPSRALSWLNKEKLKPMKLHTTKNYYRFRLYNPKYKIHRYRTKSISPTIKAIYPIPKV